MSFIDCFSCKSHSNDLLDLFVENHKLEKNEREDAFKTITPERIITLINKGADVNARDKYGNTPLHFAAKLNREDLVERLLEQGAHVDAVGKNNYTAIHLSAYLGHLGSVRVLLTYKASVIIPSHVGGETILPVDSASRHNHIAIKSLLLSHSSNL
jgi:ankyrin repeat protein